METSPTIGAISAAIAAASATYQSFGKDGSATIPMKAGGKYSYDYVTLAAILASVRPSLAANGLAIIQSPESNREGVRVRTVISHSSGEWVAATLWAPCEVGDIKAIGSAITYLRRYTLQSILGLAPDDDDDGAAVVLPAHAPRSSPRPQSAPSSRGTAEPPKAAPPATQAAGGGLSPRDRIPSLIDGISVDALSGWLASDHARAERARARFGLPKATLSAYTDSQILDLETVLIDHGSAVVEAVVEWMERP